MMQPQILEGVRISPLQKHLWLLQHADKQTPFRAQVAVLIEGKLDRDNLNLALKNVVNKHEILRTKFKCLPGMKIPVQVINDSDINWEDEYDLTGWETQQQEAKVDEIFQDMLQLPFDYEKGQNLRIAFITLSALKYILLLSLPALCADSGTLNNLVREISISYAACFHQELSDEILQYADIAEWQNELLESEDTETGREYWRKQDIAHLLNLSLPLENQSQANRGFKPQVVGLQINHDLNQKIKILAEKYNASVSVFLLACWQVLLMRLTGQSEIVIGTATNGRNYEELGTALGLFAKYLPLHTHLTSINSFSEVLQQTQECFQEISEWQDSFNWEQIKQNNKDITESCLPFCFDFESQNEKYIASPANICFSIYKQYTCIDRFKIKCSCLESDNYLNLEFHYDANLFSAENINRLAGEFETLLHSVLKNPLSAISALEILPPNELHQLLVDFNTTQAEYPKNKCIHQLFEEQVEKTPDAVAVVFENKQLTYSELNIRANQLAHYLQQLGVKLEVPVGICVERSLEMVIGLLGILKAGGAYLPIEPTYPLERQAFILKDAQTPVLLTQQHLAANLPTSATQVIYLDTDWQIINQQSTNNPVSDITTLNLAYIIYTSGSTGKPKGTLIHHQGLVNYLSWCSQAYGVEQGTGTIIHSPLGFDLTITSLFSPLLVGNQVEILSPDEGIETLANALRDRSNLSLVKITPAHLKLLCQILSPQSAAGRTRAFIIGGENLLAEDIAFWREFAPETMLVNEYGPTETVVGCCIYKVPPGENLSTSVAIGEPIANTQLYVLDQHCQPVPIGVVGDLHIGGLGLARGYLNQPQLTAQKFIPNPFSQTPGERLYKTGDLARYRADGVLEYLGRIDDQVKIRGFRIELAEIQSVILEYSGVKEAVVIAREDVPGNKRLAAYIVWNAESPSSIDVMQSFLQEKLPDYMVPSVFVPLKELPLTNNGKVNTKALPAPEQVRAASGTFVPPTTPTEKLLADIWTQVLRVERLGIHDNFFELGGDSILSIQIIAKANQAGLQLIPKQMFDHQTIAKLAAVAGTVRTIQAEQGLVKGDVFLTPIQHWFFEQNQPEPHHYNQAILLEMRQNLDREILQQVMQQLILHHDSLRLRFVKESGWKQAIATPTDIVPAIRYDFSTLSQQEQQKAIASTATKLQASFNLSVSPLVQEAIFDRGTNQPSYLLLIIHHLAVDGVSWRILLEDFQTVYAQIQAGEAIKLPAKTTSFQQWAQKLKNYVQSVELQKELDYWCSESRRQIAPIPVDFPRGENTQASARTISVSLSVADTQALLQKVPAAYQTQINDVLLTALVQTFAEWMGEPTLLLDLEGHGREEIFDDVDLSRTVGWFTTIFPVLLKLPATSDLATTVKTIKEQLREIPNRGIGYGVLRYLSSDAIAEKLQTLPQAEVLFNYLGQSDQVLFESSPFSLADADIGAARSPRGSRCHLLDINAIVVAEQLQISWTYSNTIHRQRTVENLAQNFIKALRSATLGGTPSLIHQESENNSLRADLSDFQWSETDLENIIAAIGDV
ncbi:non-ribosomal peptide synthetase [Chroococcidiopsis thermalis]|uniref:Amino acid adenylation domain protein n=1 Tax=Chroococcidiopsis thermalis (strain PCC 7203) TaxID=251229 RepID=K9U2W5_CHRTP|nr:non-ribosomal peptide synthetase [Chroococcidiopsis thermalis]AFY89165.1 amino acid adenylation domain protein [Chroococcidiopsis thermalis PCC 7203]PSB47356.1 non-ribosomal peptide synthetase [Cyanosarcina cf. burmensis CCALA 770]